MYPTDTAVTMWKYSLNANSFVAASEPQPFKKYTSAATKEKMAWVVEIMLFVVVVVVVVVVLLLHVVVGIQHKYKSGQVSHWKESGGGEVNEAK